MKTCESCGEERNDVVVSKVVSGDGNWGISKPSPWRLCEDCEQGLERCEHCCIYYDETALARSLWAGATPDYGQGNHIDEIVEEMIQIFLCDACVKKLLHKEANEKLIALFRKLDYWRVIESLLGGVNGQYGDFSHKLVDDDTGD